MNNNKRKRKGKQENKIPNHKLAWPCSQNAKKITNVAIKKD
jgi:hypothetical protein